jgi:hypothetical protein
MTPQVEEAVLMALMRGKGIRGAAMECGLSPRTIYRRLEDPVFVKRLQTLRAELIGDITGMLQGSSIIAVGTLQDLMGINVPPDVRLRAAKTILELGIKMREVIDLANRLAVLEERAALHTTMETSPDATPETEDPLDEHDRLFPPGDPRLSWNSDTARTVPLYATSLDLNVLRTEAVAPEKS